jgi:flagellar basal-body rod protein FlgG
MPEGIYSAAAGMAAQQTRLDALANDVANVNTTAYKQQRLGFRDLVYQAEQGIPIGAGSAPVDVGRSFQQGALTETGDTLSVAIVGPGFFQVRRSDGSVALTRDGRLALDATGAIVTTTGQKLVPPLTVPKGTDPAAISISPTGAVSVGTTSIGRLSIVTVPAPGALAPAGDNLFAPTAASGAPAAVVGTTVQQGALEASNVDLATAMTDMIDAQRGYELASRAIKTQDQLLDVANQLVR